jgi:hypothetical protein
MLSFTECVQLYACSCIDWIGFADHDTGANFYAKFGFMIVKSLISAAVSAGPAQATAAGCEVLFLTPA